MDDYDWKEAIRKQTLDIKIFFLINLVSYTAYTIIAFRLNYRNYPII